MDVQQTQEMFLAIVRGLQEAVPEGREGEFQVSAEGQDQKVRVFQLVPEEKSRAAFDAAMALTPDEAFACVNQVHNRAGIRKSLHPVAMTFFANPLWKPLFDKAAGSDAARAKKAGGSPGT